MSSDRTFCAKSTAGGPCLGDSGGGLFVKQTQHWYLRGIISGTILDRNESCDIAKHSIFTNFFKFTDWIIQETGLKITDTLDPPVTTTTTTSPRPLPSLLMVTRSMWNAAPSGPDILYLQPPSKRVMIAHTVTGECHTQDDCAELLQNI